MDVYRVQTGTKYGTLFANNDENLAEIKAWFLSHMQTDLENDVTLTQSVVDQAMLNWQSTFDEIAENLSFDLTDEGLCQALAGGYTSAGGDAIINKSMGLEPWG